MNLKLKIFSGFLILSLMLLIAGIISIREFLNIGQSVQDMLDENYKSINASNKMIEALEREDSGILMLLMGHEKDGINTITSGDSLFSDAFMIASNNLTIENEGNYIREIENSYSLFKKKWLQLTFETRINKSLPWYYKNIHSEFLNVKKAVNKLMVLNQNTLYNTASSLKSQAHRSVIPGIVAIVSSFIFAVLFYFFIHLYIIKPIIRITKAIEEYNEKEEPYNIKIETKDELNNLNESIKKLLTKIK